MSRPNASTGFVPDALTAARFEDDDAVPDGVVLVVIDGTALPVALGVIAGFGAKSYVLVLDVFLALLR